MRRAVFTAVLSAGLVLGAMRPGAAQTFAGTVRYTIHDENGKTMNMVQLSKPGHYSMQFTGEGKAGGLIVDSSAGTTTFVSSDDSSYFVISKEMMQGMTGMMQGMAGMMHRGGADSSKATDVPKVSIRRTGTAVVAGINCEVYAYDGMSDNKHVTGEVCLAKGVGALFPGNPMGGMMGGMGGMGMGAGARRPSLQERLRAMGPLGDMIAQGYGVLKLKNNEDGKPKGSIEVTGIERGTPPDAAFAPPTGYKEKTMGDMMGGGRRP